MIYDPLRKKEVAETPEEKVRQWFIGLLNSTFGVPAHMMMSEVSMKFGEKPYRADILVYGRSGEPLAVVECKRESVQITSEVVLQALRYNAVLDVRYIILTNGAKTFLFEKKDGEFRQMDHIPDYKEMTR